MSASGSAFPAPSADGLVTGASGALVIKRHRGRLVSIADRLQHSISTARDGVVLDPHRCGLGGAHGIELPIKVKG